MRPGVTCGVVVLILLATPLAILPPAPGGGGGALASPAGSPEGTLTVDGLYQVSGYELWGDVVVGPGGALVVGSGGYLVAGTVRLESTSVLEIQGGMVELRHPSHREWVGVRGDCERFSVTSGGVLRVTGTDGRFDLDHSAGGDAVVQVRAFKDLRVTGATLELRGGAGMSPPAPLTSADLDGHRFAGGNATFLLTLVESGRDLCLNGSTVSVVAGPGGAAPDGGTPPETNVFGAGGGYSSGGNVTGHVGAGGEAMLALSGASVVVRDCQLEVSGGRGGDAGDGADLEFEQAGGGGGGYSGGHGAYGLRSPVPAAAGGNVSGGVGAGGSAWLRLFGDMVLLETSLVSLDGGPGGRGGDGGVSGQGGGGGGGYSGGGGGSYQADAGGPGGSVSGSVGSGGDAHANLTGTSSADVVSTTLLLHAGRGGDGGHGGTLRQDPEWVEGGFGGGGYSGGGGGGQGSADGSGPGNDGGAGGSVQGRVGSGGDASLAVCAPVSLVTDAMLEVAGGDGGMAGAPGEGRFVERYETTAGGGAGGHSSGGGGGGGCHGSGDGAGGHPGDVGALVASGGDASIGIWSDSPTVARSCSLNVTGGEGGPVGPADALGDVGGRGAVAATLDGERSVHVPMSVPRLFNPTDGKQMAEMESFMWSELHDSTTGGAVTGYKLVVDDDRTPGAAVLVRTLATGTLEAPVLPQGVYYWFVVPLYSGPPVATGPTSEVHKFIYSNVAPRAHFEEPIQVEEGVPTVVELAEYITDPDNEEEDLVLSTSSGAVTAIDGLNVTVLYAEFLPGIQNIRFTISDGVNHAFVKMPVTIIDVNQDPEILTVGGQEVPATLEVDERATVYLEVVAVDDRPQGLSYSLRNAWRGVSLMPNGTLRVHARDAEVGTFHADLLVEDSDGGADGTRLTFRVRNVQDPPGPVTVYGPGDGSIHLEHEPVDFAIGVSDPDNLWGEDLEVVVSSDINGVLLTTRATDFVQFSTVDLEVGTHELLVTATDGTFTKQAFLELEVVPLPRPPQGPSGGDDMEDRVLMAAILSMMPLIGYMAGTMGVRRDDHT